MTGAASGIGLATVQRLLEEDDVVVAIDRDEVGLRDLQGSCPGVITSCCDVTDYPELNACVTEAADRFGRIDVLVNNAGISYYERHGESTLEHWRQTLTVNLESMYVLAQYVVPYMVKRRFGRIVNVASTQAIAAEPTVGAYAASKGGIGAWSRSLAVDLAEHNILVNVVAPGCVHTPMSIIDGVDETATDLFQEWYVRRRKIPLGRAGEPHEVADAIAFLASERCTYITGHTLVVDGGLTITF